MAGHRKVKQPVTNGAAKVPVIMQMEALECGAACLAMVLAYYGKWVPLEQVRSDCGVSRDGSNARNVLKAARNYGLEAAGYRYEPEDLKKEGHFPCIVHWEFNHFIVVNGIKGNMVYVNDPARGSVTMTMEQFDGGFTGVCLMFSPTEAFEPGGKQKSMIEFAKERLSGAETAVVFVVLTTIIGSLAAIIQSGFLRVFMDYMLPGYNPEWVMPFLLALTGLSILQIAAAWIQAVYSLRINGKMAVVGSTSYLWKVLHLPMEFFTQRMAGDIQLRQGTNETIANDIVNTVAPLAMNTVMMIFYLVVMIRYSPLLTLVGILTVVLNTWVSRIIAKKRVNITRVMMRDEGKLASVKVSGIEMIETIKSSGAENGYFEKWSGYQASVNAQRVKYQKLDAYLGMIPMFLNALAGAAVLIIGVGLCIKGNFSVGMIMAFQGFMTRFTAPADELINASRTIQEMRTQMERVGDVMEYPEDKAFKKEDLKEDEEYGKLSGSISMKNVTFGYSKLAEPLIENFNLELKPGSRVAFVGASGCGKSTLSKLISGLYEPWSGEILFDGKPMNEIDRGVFTGSVAVVDQDIILFEDTIANNIKMWDNSIEDFEMILAARDAQIHEDIMVRDGGYRYKITEGGKDFSGGQRQRLEIARVLAQDPTVIIMDEATSALDARTEYEVTKAIKDRGITCVVIAHRLSTIRDCDEIVVLDRGKVLERGTHEELMKNNGAYTRLVTVE
ncbi:MAG: NHLP family bacteriocin export ABC transporter peptidase/permease/ATPase subunit [Lachnospiraceae bacterium]|nr:NHLP family bacteriocin export ABC transporter peptidase/permease/ATPase subunit [Lachnospiraceae bacterium]